MFTIQASSVISIEEPIADKEMIGGVPVKNFLSPAACQPCKPNAKAFSSPNQPQIGEVNFSCKSSRI